MTIRWHLLTVMQCVPWTIFTAFISHITLMLNVSNFKLWVLVYVNIFFKKVKCCKSIVHGYFMKANALTNLTNSTSLKAYVYYTEYTT